MLSRSILVFAILPSVTFAASRGKWCEVSQSVESQLAHIKSSPLLTPAQRAHAEKQITNLLARYPGNLFVYLRDQSITNRATKADRQAMIARYHKLMAAHPNDPLYQFLYAHALLDVNTPQSIQIAKKLLAEDPDFARAHVLLADAYSWGKFAHHTEALRQIGAFFSACPGALDSEALSLAQQLADQKLAAKILPPIEVRLSKATDQQELEFWQYVWPLAFTARPVTEDAVRDRVPIAVLKNFVQLRRHQVCIHLLSVAGVIQALPQQVFQLNFGVGIAIAVLHDDRRIKRKTPIAAMSGLDLT